MADIKYLIMDGSDIFQRFTFNCKFKIKINLSKFYRRKIFIEDIIFTFLCDKMFLLSLFFSFSTATKNCRSRDRAHFARYKIVWRYIVLLITPVTFLL